MHVRDTLRIEMAAWVLMAMVIVASAGERPAITRPEAEVLELAAAIAETNQAAAVAMLQEARERPRASAALDYSAGNLLLSLGEFAAAQSAYEAALKKHPDFRDAKLGSARSLLFQELWPEADAVVRPLATAAEASLDVLLMYGYILVAQERFVSAETVYRRAMLLAPDTQDAVMGLAQAFLGQQRYSEAASLLREWVQRSPADASVWQLLAEIEWTAGREDAALTVLETARRLVPLSTAMVQMLGELYQSRGMPAAAVRVYESFETDWADTPAILLRWVEALLDLDRIAAAGERLDLVEDVHQTARHHEVRMRWAQAADEPEIIREALHRWIELDPTNKAALLAMGDAEAEAGDLEAASLWYDRARLAHSQSSAPLMRLARLALDRERFAEAARWLEQAHVLSGDPQIERSLQQVRRLADIQ